MDNFVRIVAGIDQAAATLVRAAKPSICADTVTLDTSELLAVLVGLKRVRDFAVLIEASERRAKTVRDDAGREQAEYMRKLIEAGAAFRSFAYQIPADDNGMIPRAKLVPLLQSFSRTIEDAADNYAAKLGARCRPHGFMRRPGF